jgi:hypothetical protein
MSYAIARKGIAKMSTSGSAAELDRTITLKLLAGRSPVQLYDAALRLSTKVFAA